MQGRGRKSAASLELVSSSRIETVRRPEPPAELTEEQAEEWNAVVSRLPADWFPRETQPMLAQYCRHVIAARRIGQLIGAEEAKRNLDLDAYDKLLKLQEREGRALSSLATRMRMTQQATYDKSKKKPLQVENPWD